MRTTTVSSTDRPLRTPFRIAGEEHFDVTTVTVSISANGATGRGECNPFSVPGWTKDSVLDEIERVRAIVDGGVDRFALLDLMPPGPARNAVDCALIDLECAVKGVPAGTVIGVAARGPVVSAMTIGLDASAGEGLPLAEFAGHPVIKLKIDSGSDPSLLAALRSVAPNAVVIVDANGSLDERAVETWLPHLSRHGVNVFEQPMRRGGDEYLASVKTDVLLCADESFQCARDLADCASRYDMVNIKLDKVGGLTAAVQIYRAASSLGLVCMAGCMMGTSLSAAPAWWFAQLTRFADIDGPTLLASDIDSAMTWRNGAVSRPVSRLWG